MKKNKIHNLILYLIIFSLIGFIIISNKHTILNNTKIVLKNMNETTEVSNLNKTIETLNASHTEYANYIQTSKQKIINAINNYPNSAATENNSLEELSTMIKSLTNVPENTYYYVNGTEGNASTIVRYKKVDNKYYICDEHGNVASGTISSDVSSLTLVPYTGITSANLTSNYAGYASGNFYLGSRSNVDSNIVSIYNALKNKGFTPKSTNITDIVNCINSITAKVEGGGIGGWSSAGTGTLILTTFGQRTWTSSNSGIQFTLSFYN